jgi:murine toxin
MEALRTNPNLTVDVVVSPLDAGAGAEGDQYSFGSGAIRTFELIKYYMTHEVETDAPLPDQDGKRADALRRIRVAPFYFTDQVPPSLSDEGLTYKWPNLSPQGYTATLKQPPLSERSPSHGVIGSAALSVINASGLVHHKVPSAPGNHAKLMIIDDQAYVIGSDNLYPGSLSEFNYVVEGSDAVSALIDSYWKPLWQYSSPYGFSG